MKHTIPLEHPGVIIREEFMEPLGVTAYAVSKGTGISRTALGEILKGKRGVSPVNALKLSRFFGMSEEFFFNLQNRYNLDSAREKAGTSLSEIIPYNGPGRSGLSMTRLAPQRTMKVNQ